MMPLTLKKGKDGNKCIEDINTRLGHVINYTLHILEYYYIFSLIGKVSAFEAANYWFKSIKVLKFHFIIFNLIKIYLI